MDVSGKIQRVCFEHAVRSAVFRPFSSPVALSALMILSAAAPLYLLDYQSGDVPVLGWFLAFLLGGVGAGIVLIGETGEEVGIEWRGRLLEAAIHRGFTISVMVGGPLAVYTWAASSLPVLEQFPVVASWMTNTAAWAWKPIAHVCVGGVLAVCIGRVAIVDLIASGWRGTDKAFYEVDGDAGRVMVYMFLLVALSFVPVAGILSVPIAVRLMINLAANATPRQ